jgi:hypothetical protein
VLEHGVKRRLRHDDVVDERRPHGVRRRGERGREADVFGAGRRIAAGVVVHDDERARPFAERHAEHVASGDGEPVQASDRHAPRGAQPVAAVERDEPHLFVVAAVRPARRPRPHGPGICEPNGR